MTRKSGIELMRIILFVMVTSIHVYSPFLNDNNIVGTVNWQFANFMDGISRIAVNVFVLITGFFLCEKKIDTKKQIKNLLKPMAFCLVPYVYLYFQDYNNIIYAVFHLIKDLFQNQIYFYHMWYIQIIFIIYMICHYLNLLIVNMKKEDYKKLLVILIMISSVIPTFTYIFEYKFININLFSSRLTLFITLYFVGGYIRKHLKINIKLFNIATLFIISELLIVFLTIIYNYKMSPLIFFNKFKGITLTYPFDGFIGAFYDYSNIIVIISATLFFILFLKLKFTSKFINYIGDKIYGAYILHVFWITILARISAVNPFAKYENVYYPLYAMVFIVLVVFCSIGSGIIINLFLKWCKRLIIQKKKVSV